LIPDDNETKTTSSDAREYTDRAVNDPDPTQQVPLGEYNDVAPMAQHQVDCTNVPDIHSMNFETFELNGMLEREYPVTYTWLSSAGVGTHLATLNVLNKVLTEPFIASKVSNFLGITCGFRVTVRMPITKFCYGKIMVLYTPQGEHGYAPSTITECSGYPHVIVSASAGETVVFDIPMIYPARYFHLDTNVHGGDVLFYVMNPLTDVSGSANSMEIFVTCQLLEPKLLLPIATQSSGNTVKGSKRRPPMSIVSREAKEKSSRGIISGVIEDTSKVVGKVISSSFGMNYGNIFSGASDVVTGLMRISGLSFPTTLSVTDITKINPYSDLSYGKGTDHSLKLTMDPANSVSVDPAIAGIEVDEMSLSYIAGTPALAQEPMSIGFADVGISNLIWSSHTVNTSLYMDVLRSMFMSSAGSVKLKVYITASDYHSCRIVFWYQPGGGPTVLDWASCYHKVVDVQGDTEVEFTIPYVNATYAADTTSLSGDIYATMISFSSPDLSISLPVYLNVYAAAADDFEFYGLTSFNIQSNPRAEFSKPFPPLHEEIKSYNQEGIVYGEKYESIREVIHRYQCDGAWDLVQTPSINPLNLLTTTTSTGLTAISYLYAFWRGLIRYKVLDDSNTARSVYVQRPLTQSRTFYGTTLNTNVNPIIEFSVPYYNNYAFQNSYVNSQSDAYLDSRRILVSGSSQYTTKDQVLLFSAAGDDFSFHFLRPLPTGKTITYPDTSGPAAVYAYYNAGVASHHA
jgi:hypothetical protein